MNTEELRAALHGATEGLRTLPSFATEVARGGARRVRRRRLIVASVAAATALAVGATAAIGWHSISEPAQVATDPRLTEAPKGSLSVNTEFVESALRVWREGLPNEPTAGAGVTDRLIGEPHLYWADDVDSDRVAVIMQAVRSPWEPGKQETLRGVVATRPDTGVLGIVAVVPPSHDDAYKYEPAVRFGPGGRNVLAMELEEPQYLSAQVFYDSEDRPKRDWQKMASRYGIVVGQLPDGIGPTQPAIVAGDPPRSDPGSQVPIISAVDLPADPEIKRTGLPWGEPGGQSHMMWAGSEPERWQDISVMQRRFHELIPLSPYVDRISHHHDDPSPWYLSVGLPGGKIATIGEYQAAYDPKARIYVVTSNSADVSRRPGRGTGISSAGPADPAKPLPVLAKMTDDAGWAAAAKGATLSYRTTVDGAWQGERAEALLAPLNAVQIQVQRPGQEPAIVDVR